MNIRVVNAHKFVKLFKLFLLSSELQNILVGLLIVIYPLQVLFQEFSQQNQIRISELKQIYSFDAFNSINQNADLYKFLQKKLIPQIYLNFPTPFLLYAYPIIYQSVRQNSNSDLQQQITCIHDTSVSNSTVCDLSIMSQREQDIIQQIFVADNSNFTQNCATQGYFSYYGDCPYIAMLGRDNYSDILDAMQKHQWINSDTVFVMCEFSMYDVISQSYFYIQFITEYDSTNTYLLSKSIQHSIIIHNDQAFTITILVFMFVLNILYNLKMLLEFNLVTNRWTLVGHLVNMLASWAYIGFNLAIQVLSKKIVNFQTLKNLDQLQKMQNLSALFIFLILPFRIFTWITQFKYFRWLKKFSNVVFKTFPGIFMALVMFLIVYLFAVQMNQVKLYSDLSELYYDIATAFLSAFDTNIQEISEKGYGTIQTIPYLYIFPAIFKIISFFLFLYFLSLFIDLFRKSAQLEFREKSKFEQEFSDLLEELDSRVESTKEVIREYIEKENKNKENDQNQKILLYFHLKSPSQEQEKRFEMFQDESTEQEQETQECIYNECAENQVVIRKFDDFEQMVQFIVCLTNIKSQYFSLKSGEKLRIFFYIEDQDFFKCSKVNQLNSFLELLKNKKLIFPILYFSPTFQFSHQMQVALRRVYSLSLCSDSQEVLQKFCNLNLKFKSLQQCIYFQEDFNQKRNSIKEQNINNIKNIAKPEQVLSKLPSQNSSPYQQLKQQLSNQNITSQDAVITKQPSQENNSNNFSGSTPQNSNKNQVQPQNSIKSYVSQNSSESKDQSYLY
ncbi:polycystin cation channel protein (macronuclear) [Tetrahymena thermophila SB210]|uniref:Polycystin cation channel protein n=1 Tax=Tetrahymena thermophila (strain SB210) TaxID=312017 RepID=Q23YT3_TETTS|nr:polycystin cation channel protein [Tetrahymena thermophila SB210]EAS01722.2 polycystin cation channel protein [Tetrahymena thermophila SB210]|eukprot:XP_001021967.2 polycystin cation channel protein [Tetrahymena thermophila SB210]